MHNFLPIGSFVTIRFGSEAGERMVVTERLDGGRYGVQPATGGNTRDYSRAWLVRA